MICPLAVGRCPSVHRSLQRLPGLFGLGNQRAHRQVGFPPVTSLRGQRDKFAVSATLTSGLTVRTQTGKGLGKAPIADEKETCGCRSRAEETSCQIEEASWV